MATKRAKRSKGGEPEFNPEDKYDEFPPGSKLGFGPSEGYNTFVQLNDRKLFNARALKNPVIRAFLEAPISVTYAQFKSSTREAEWFIHKPHLAMPGALRAKGIRGKVAKVPAEGAHIQTYVMNHDRTLALRPMRTLVVSDGTETGQVLYKGDGA